MKISTIMYYSMHNYMYYCIRYLCIYYIHGMIFIFIYSLIVSQGKLKTIITQACSWIISLVHWKTQRIVNEMNFTQYSFPRCKTNWLSNRRRKMYYKNLMLYSLKVQVSYNMFFCIQHKNIPDVLYNHRLQGLEKYWHSFISLGFVTIYQYAFQKCISS